MTFEWKYNEESGKPEVWYWVNPEAAVRLIDWPPRTKDSPRRVRWDVNASEDTDYWAFGYAPTFFHALELGAHVAGQTYLLRGWYEAGV